MNKKLIVFGTAVLLLVVGLSGCTNVDNQDTTQLLILLFNVEPNMINKGETANLSWNVTGATTVSIDNNIGDVSLSGTRIISPIQNTTYVLTASNSNTSKTATTLIIVLDKSESEEPVDKTFENIFFYTDILELVNGSLDITEDKEIITRVEVTLYFKNLLDEVIHVEYVVEFCDKNDNVLYDKSYEIKNLPAEYTEMSPDIFLYHEENVADFNHVNVRFLSYEVIE